MPPDPLDLLDTYLKDRPIIQSAYQVHKATGYHISTVTARLKTLNYYKSSSGNWVRSSKSDRINYLEQKLREAGVDF